jgi:hypothetical protein
VAWFNRWTPRRKSSFVASALRASESYQAVDFASHDRASSARPRRWWAMARRGQDLAETNKAGLSASVRMASSNFPAR